MTASPAWMDRAACLEHDPETWHPLMGQADVSKQARIICNGRDGNRQRKAISPCPVKAQCLAWALTNNETSGVWGGLTARQRQERRSGKRAA